MSEFTASTDLDALIRSSLRCSLSCYDIRWAPDSGFQPQQGKAISPSFLSQMPHNFPSQVQAHDKVIVWSKTLETIAQPVS